MAHRVVLGVGVHGQQELAALALQGKVTLGAAIQEAEIIKAAAAAAVQVLLA